MGFQDYTGSVFTKLPQILQNVSTGLVLVVSFIFNYILSKIDSSFGRFPSSSAEPPHIYYKLATTIINERTPPIMLPTMRAMVPPTLGP